MRQEDANISNKKYFLCLFLISLILYFPALKAGFVLDAHYVIEENPIIKHPSGLLKILYSNAFSSYKLDQDFTFSYYRPFLIFSFAVEYMMVGLKPHMFRFTNILLHYFNAILIYYLIFKLFRYRKMAILTSLIFLIMPIHEWVVCYLVGRGDLLQAFFSLWMCLVFISYVEDTKKKVYLFLSLVFFLFALLSREVSILNPLFILCITVFYTQNIRKIFKLSYPYFLMSLVYFVIRINTAPIMENSFSILSFNFINHGISLVVSYALRFFIPWSLLAFMPEAFHGAYVFLALAFLFLAVFYFIFSKKDKQAQVTSIFAFTWMLLGLMPILITQEIVNHIGSYLSEHFLYYSSIGFALLIAAVLLQVKSIFIRQCLLSFIIPYYLIISFTNHLAWTSEENILRKTALLEKHRFKAAEQQLLMRYDRNKERIMQLIALTEKDSRKSIWYRRLGEIEREEGNYNSAVYYFEKAILLNSKNLSARNALAVCFLEKGLKETGLKILAESQRLDNSYFETYFIYGQSEYFEGKYVHALPYLEKAVFLNPDFVPARFYLMMSYFFMGNKQKYFSILLPLKKNKEQMQVVNHFFNKEIQRIGVGHVLAVVDDLRERR